MFSDKINSFCVNPYRRERFVTREVAVGNIIIGGDHPIVVQSMTTADTMDTARSVEECIRLIEAGCTLIRLTAPSIKEAENLGIIRSELKQRGYSIPLIADIHFTPNAAEVAAKIVEKVRVNPGNYADKKRFEHLDYTEASYAAELARIEEKFTPLVLLCKEQGTAMRIGTNHGSLSDRILSRYGDTPQGMVASAMEFLKICAKHDFHDVVLSMKASNTLVMVQAYRLLVATLRENAMNYPLHLGVTEAGDGEDGRIKSAVGIGALLEDGLGDTIRVSLTEAPEAEIPVARKLLDKFSVAGSDFNVPEAISSLVFDPYSFRRYPSRTVLNVGSDRVPVVFADLSHIDLIKPSHLFPLGYHYSVPLDKWNIRDQSPDYIYTGSSELTFPLPGTLRRVVDFDYWNAHKTEEPELIPLVKTHDLTSLPRETVCFVVFSAEDPDIEALKNLPNAIFIAQTEFRNKTQVFRYLYALLDKENITNPVILKTTVGVSDAETFQLWTSSDLGSLLIDGLGDGVWAAGNASLALINSTAFGILQATRLRISKTEYISCPSCGRTLFDLQETTAKIRSRTSHLKGIKIGIMGCIVNGPGEMADADYGYVGTGPGKITLYKEKEVVRKNISEVEAVDALISLIKEHGDWIEPSN